MDDLTRMGMLATRLKGYEPLPPYTDARSALKIALAAMRPAELITVTESAERNMRVNVSGQWQPFRRDVTPYMVEPTDTIASRSFRALAFCGPSQSGKTQMLQSAVAYTIASDPGRLALFQMTRDAAALFEREKISPMIRNSPELRAKMAAGRGSDNLYQKLFIGGTHLTLDWPTVEKLSSTTIRLVMATDFDRFGASIDGEGDPLTMMRARARSFRSRGMAVIESSPGAPITDENWKAKTPHDCPPVKYGVLAAYPQGTRGRWYWPCPCCGVEFEPTCRRLIYPDSLDPAEAGEAALMRCPNPECRQTFGHELKRELNAEGRWLHEAQPDEDGRIQLVPIGDERLRRTDTASYWLDGAAAAFATWAELVEQYEAALESFDTTGDEEKLKAAMNTGQAQPYFPRSASSDMEVTLQGLKDKAEGISTPKSVAPDWTRYITVSVDVQGTYFSVGVTAWGEGGKHQPIDRFDLVNPPATAPGAEGRALKPFEIAEDWAVLEDLPHRAWPVDGGEWLLKPAAIAIDVHGGGASTDHAYKFYRGRKKAGEARRWYLTRGHGGLNHPDRVWLRAPERTSNKNRKAAVDIKILNMATDRLKDATAASLRLSDDGQNITVIPEWMSVAELTEFTAERRTEKGWEKRQGMVRNESFDHAVQARALHIILGGERIDWSDPLPWVTLAEGNDFAVSADADPSGDEPKSPNPDRVFKQTEPHAPGRGGWIQRRDSWI